MIDSIVAAWARHAVLLLHVGSTLALVGLIWTVQVVQYPLFAKIGGDFAAYHAGHTVRIGVVVIPLMLVELTTALWLVWSPRPEVSRASAWVGLGLVVVIWLSTFFLQVPAHGVLAGGFDTETHHVLVVSNWIRTVAWTLRALLVLTWVAQALRPPGATGPP